MPVAQIDKENPGSGIDKPDPKTLKEKISDRLRGGLGGIKDTATERPRPAPSQSASDNQD
jgi:hypothetical protein